jgi:predicted kinase
MAGVPGTIERLENAMQSMQSLDAALDEVLVDFLSEQYSEQKTNKLYLLIGLPGSGKTSLAKEMQAQDPNLRRVNKDGLRSLIDNGIYSKEKERLIRSLHLQIAIESLKDGYSVVCDDAGLIESRHRDVLIDVADRLGVEVVWELRLLDVSVEECVDRDSKREKPVGQAVIRSFAEKLDLLKKELFD